MNFQLAVAQPPFEIASVHARHMLAVDLTRAHRICSIVFTRTHVLPQKLLIFAKMCTKKFVRKRLDWLHHSMLVLALKIPTLHSTQSTFNKNNKNNNTKLLLAHAN